MMRNEKWMNGLEWHGIEWNGMIWNGMSQWLNGWMEANNLEWNWKNEKMEVDDMIDMIEMIEMSETPEICNVAILETCNNGIL